MGILSPLQEIVKCKTLRFASICFCHFSLQQNLHASAGPFRARLEALREHKTLRTIFITRDSYLTLTHRAPAPSGVGKAVSM